MGTKLDRLNKLLKDPKLNLPSFRQEVSPSFGNLKWLQSKLLINTQCPEELKALLRLDPKSLLEPHVSCQGCQGACGKELAEAAGS